MYHPRAIVLGSAGLAALVLLGACAVGPDFARPAAPAGTRYTREPAVAVTVEADGRAQHFMTGGLLQSDWWTLFHSEAINGAVRQALIHSPTVQASEASLRASQDALRAGYGVFYPYADAAAGASRQRSLPALQGVQSTGSVYNLITLSGTVGYAFDVFGGKRRAVEGLRAQVDVQTYANAAAHLSLSANVVNTCIALAAYDAELRETEQLLDLERQQLRATEVQASAGTSAYSSVLSVRALLATSQAALAPLRQRISHAEHLLASLEGIPPVDAVRPDMDWLTLTLPAELPVSVPSELARQRPDILAAEAQLHVASANIGVATAAMFPSFTLTGDYGAAGSRIGDLGGAGSRFWSIGPAATIPIFQGGTLWYGRKAAIDTFQHADAVYRQTVLDALAQVADALTALERDADALQAEFDARQAAASALSLLQANYQAGLVSYLDVIVADILFRQATIAYLDALAQRYQDTVALYVALGGGWWNAAPREAPGASG